MTKDWGYEDKRVLVAGGGGAGMGAAVVKELGELGAEIHVLDLREPTSPVASYQQTDLSDPDAIIAAAEQVGPVGSLFYCAGLPGPPFSGLEVFTVNFIAARHLTEKVTNDLMPDGGSVCTISSAAGMAWMSHIDELTELVQTNGWEEAVEWAKKNEYLISEGYNLSKESLIFWTQYASTKLAASGIRINCISPGPTTTPMWPQFEAIAGKEMLESVPRPLGRNSTPEEQAGVMVFLNGDGGSYITGSNLYTDGGFTAALLTGQAEFIIAIPE